MTEPIAKARMALVEFFEVLAEATETERDALIAAALEQLSGAPAPLTSLLPPGMKPGSRMN